MFGLYDLEGNLITGPFTTRGTAMMHAIENGIAPFVIEEL